MLTAQFDHFAIVLTVPQAIRCRRLANVADVLQEYAVKQQLNGIPAMDIASELRRYGVWSDSELTDDVQNRVRIVWLAAGIIDDERRK